MNIDCDGANWQRKIDMKLKGKNITQVLGINRRNFVKFFVGGVIGTGLSPFPWKLTDDLAIWTQNWPWVPVPPVDEMTHEKSLCKLCPGGCGIEVRKAGERAVKIEGRSDYPVNAGGLCPVGMGGLQLLYNEGNRFTGPMKRIGLRGSGDFQEISWEEALDMLAARISFYRENGKPESIVAIDGNTIESTMSLMVERLIKAIGSTNYMRIPSSVDTSRMVDLLMQGNRGPTTYDMENSDYILSFGCGLLDGWGSPGRVFNAWRTWKAPPLKDKIRIVQVESRASDTASKADQWIPARPGTESALALGLAHIIIKERAYDRDFVENMTFGFSDWESPYGNTHKGFASMVLEGYSPSRVADITGIEEKDIVSLARDFAMAGAPLALCGKGKGRLNGSIYEFMAVRALNALVGNINQPGGIIIQDPIPLAQLPDIELDLIAEKGLKNPRIDRSGSRRYPFSHSLFNNFSEAVLTSNQAPVNILLVFSSNPCFTLPDGGDLRRAMEKIPFIVSFSPYRDETAYMSDLVLPDHTYLEKKDDVVWPSGLQYPLYGLTRPVVDPLYNTKNSGDVILRLAKMLQGSVKASFPWHDYEDVLKIRAKGLFDSGEGLTMYDGAPPECTTFDEMWKRINTGGLWYRPGKFRKKPEDLFNTASGKFEFFSTRIKDAFNNWDPEDMGALTIGDEAFMPHYELSEADSREGLFPLRMVPYEIINLASGWQPSPPYLTKILFDNQLLKTDSFAEVNPETAAKLDVEEGDMVSVISPKGKIQARVHVFEGAMPGIVYMLLGLGHWAYDDFLRGKGVNPNDIIDGGLDPLSGQPVWWDTPVRLVKV